MPQGNAEESLAMLSNYVSVSRFGQKTDPMIFRNDTLFCMMRHSPVWR